MTDWENITPNPATNWEPGPVGEPSTYLYVDPSQAFLKASAEFLQNEPVSEVTPTSGQFLVYLGGAWTPSTSSGGGGTTAHSGLTGLEADDHSQYLTTSRHNALLLQTHSSGLASDGFVATADGVGGVAWEALPVGGVSDHGLLIGLADDDHPQYLTNAEHNVLSHNNADHGNFLGLADDDHTQYLNTARHVLSTHTSTNVDHGNVGGLADDDHGQYLNNARHDLAARHGIGTVIAVGTTGNSAPGDIAATGSAGSVSRSDHLHGRESHGSAQHGATIVDHGTIGGLADDDHAQYLNAARHDTTTRHVAATLAAGTATNDFVIKSVAGVPTWAADATGGGGVTFGSPAASAPGDVSADGVSTSATRADHKHARETHLIANHDHGGLGGLADDDHAQYLNTARHDLLARHPAAVIASGTATDNFIIRSITGTATWAQASHSLWLNLGADDHTQYLNTTRHDTTTRHPVGVLGAGAQTSGHVLTLSGTTPTWTAPSGGGGVTDHGLLTGLADDDHPQYLTNAEHNVLTHNNVDHGAFLGLADDDHTQYLNATRHASNALSHTITSSVDENIATLSAQIGVASGTPRLVLSEGTAANNWQIDNNVGQFRWITPGNARMTMQPDPASSGRTILNLPDGFITIGGRRLVSGPVPSLTLPSRWSSAPVGSTNVCALNTAYASPLWIERNLSISQLGVRIGAAVSTATCRLAVYDDNGDGYPGSLLAETGSLAAAAIGTVTGALGSALSLQPGLYWLAVVGQTVAPSLIAPVNFFNMTATSAANVLAANGVRAYAMLGVSAAFPATWTATIGAGAVAAAIAYLRSA